MKESSNINNKESIGSVLRILINHLSQSIRHIFQNNGITSTEFLVLQEVFEYESISLSDIALHLKLTKGSVSKVIDQLIDKNLIIKKVSSLDKRVQKIFLTENAHKVIPKLIAQVQSEEKVFFSNLTALEKNEFYSLVKKMTK